MDYDVFGTIKVLAMESALVQAPALSIAKRKLSAKKMSAPENKVSKNIVPAWLWISVISGVAIYLFLFDWLPSPLKAILFYGFFFGAAFIVFKGFGSFFDKRK